MSAQSTLVPSRPAPAALRALRQAGYEIKTILGNGEQLLVSLALPLMAMVALTWLDLLDGFAPSRIDAATPGVLALCVVSVAFTGQGIQTGFDRQYGVLRSLATTPLGRGGLILGKGLAVLAVIAVQVVVIGVVARLMGWHPALPGWLPALVILLLGAAAFTSLGLLIAGTLRPQATLAITNLIWVLLAAVGGLLLPLAKLPGLLGTVATLLPSSALGEGLRAALIHGRFDPTSLLVLAVWAVLGTAAAVRWFRWE
ncbi:ABC transporter permease [Galactobacter caseinivorans]|uniref:ABC transporter permease n=1 Tax=Galactobacter caseinivorans TaxID=2676123 RepID=A0A496PKP8_9MICC|nr:ABC transporter permease [Galactobacter caseinivorans]RKW71071.1 ABC transporter permease [Galactobacter caseinivorans]